MNAVTLAIIAGIELQREKLQKAAKRYAKSSIAAAKRRDFERAITQGAKAAAAVYADKILKEQQERLRRADS